MSLRPAVAWVVIPAAGVGARMNADRPKQYLPLAGKTVIEHTLHRFLGHPRIAGIVLALDADDTYWASLDITTAKPLDTVTGGRERCHSVLNALVYLRDVIDEDAWVLVHDAARPCLAAPDLDALFDALGNDPVGGLLATPVRDTIKRADRELRVDATIDRSALWHALTPQMFRLGLLTRALQQSLADDFLVTDEASAVEHFGLQPRLIEGRADNIKITRPEDLALAEHYLTIAQ